jgi:hypothetical protein
MRESPRNLYNAAMGVTNALGGFHGEKKERIKFKSLDDLKQQLDAYGEKTVTGSAWAGTGHLTILIDAILKLAEEIEQLKHVGK